MPSSRNRINYTATLVALIVVTGVVICCYMVINHTPADSSDKRQNTTSAPITAEPDSAPSTAALRVNPAETGPAIDQPVIVSSSPAEKPIQLETTTQTTIQSPALTEVTSTTGQPTTASVTEETRELTTQQYVTTIEQSLTTTMTPAAASSSQTDAPLMESINSTDPSMQNFNFPTVPNTTPAPDQPVTVSEITFSV